MIKEATLPEISENVESGEVIEVLVSVDDMVEKEQSLAVLETEKATFEVPSPAAGKIVEISISEGDTVKVGQVIAKIDTEGKAEAKPKEKEEGKTPEEKEAKEAKEAEKKEAPKKTEKPQRKQPQKSEKRRDEPKAEKETPEGEKSEAPPKTAGVVPAAPSVRQFARELGIDIAQVAGSTPGGRISIDDVKRYVKQAVVGSGGQSAASGAQMSKPLPDFSKWGPVERKAASVTRKKIAETLSFTWSNIPQVTQYDQADITLLEEFRKEYGDQVKEAGGKLTMTSILLKAVTMALQKFPKFNTSYDPDSQEIIYKQYYHIAIAVDTDRGLLVPVVRDVDQKSLLELSVELSELAEKARNHKVTPDDMTGGNFTISNLGGLGGTAFAPIIYWPQTAILGVARGAKQPVFVEGRVESRLIVPLSLSYDHRIIDGAEGVRFLRYIVDLLEKPFLLVLNDSNQ
jgi:pyruvate dehydrogenase E2 component (dihydrolipoamide acetyltransferase)